jgi:acetoacetyl-CoA synthetase
MAKLLWQPSEDRIRSTNMYRFMMFVNEKYNKNFDEYAPLYKWSIDKIPEFWSLLTSRPPSLIPR